MPPIRVGLVGAGNVALIDHIPAYRRRPDLFTVVAVADPTPERRSLAADATGLRPADAHADASELLARDDLDMVDVCTPQHLRRDLVIEACESGRHVLSEKPIATVPRDAADMVAAARLHGVRYGIVHNFLFFPEVLRTREVIESGEIGPVEVAILNWLSVEDRPGNPAYRPAWRHDPRQAGGGVLMDMLHIVYLAEALLGSPIERVSGYVDARQDTAAVEEIALARFETASKAALVNVGWGVGPGGIAISGREGRIEITYEGGASGAFVPLERMFVTGRSGREEMTDLQPDVSMDLVLADFAAAIVDAHDPVAPGEQGLHALEATLAVYESAALGRTVELPLQPGDPVYERGVAGIRDLEIPTWSTIGRRHIFGAA
ncbi:MAG: Gfo/Idh/MocA family protein [Chloroflexota bacterium]